MRKAFFFIVKAAVSGALLFLALKFVDLRTLTNRLSHLNPGWIALGVMALILQTMLLSMRWKQIILQCGEDLSILQLFRFCMVGTFFNQTLPSSVGGDAMRVWLVGKQTNWRTASYSVLLDRGIGLAVLAALVVVCLPWTLQIVTNPIGRTALLVIGLGALGGWFGFVSLGLHPLHILERWLLTRHLLATATIAAQIFRARRSLGLILGISVSVQFLTVLLAWCAARSIGADLTLEYSLFLTLPVALVTVVPISIAGWGVREGAMVAAFAYAGLSRSDGLAVSILFGGCYLILGAIGGLIWILNNSEFTLKGPVRHATIPFDMPPSLKQ